MVLTAFISFLLPLGTPQTSSDVFLFSLQMSGQVRTRSGSLRLVERSSASGGGGMMPAARTLRIARYQLEL